MKFILFVEGHTEKKALAPFLKRWLDPQLPKPVGLQAVRFNGWSDLVKDSTIKAKLYLSQPDVIAVIALLDLYGPTIYSSDLKTSTERYRWGKEHLESKVDQLNFSQFFAVHEVEAWLLSDPSIFPDSVKSSIQEMSSFPEKINNTEPPKKRLQKIYKKEINRRYKEVTFGSNLFSKLDPNIAYQKCPYLKDLLDEMLRMAKTTSE